MCGARRKLLTTAPVLKRFKHLAAKMEVSTAVSNHGNESPQSQLNKYITEMQETVQHPDALAYWNTHRATYHHLADTALDLVAAPASQAFVERIFSVCGMLSQGRRNKMLKSLEMRVRLKLNAKLFA